MYLADVAIPEKKSVILKFMGVCSFSPPESLETFKIGRHRRHRAAGLSEISQVLDERPKL